MISKKVCSIFALLLLLLFSTNGADAKEKRAMPTTSKSTVVLQSVGYDFIIALERKFMVTKETRIEDKKGNAIPLRRLEIKKKIELEYIFTTGSALPVATIIKKK